MSRSDSIVVTGAGLASCLGQSAAQCWEMCRRGASGIAPIERFEVAGHACRAGAVVAPFDASRRMRVPKHVKFASAPLRLGLLAASEALDSSGMARTGIPPERIAINTGAGDSGLEAFEFFPAFEVAVNEGDPEIFTKLGGRASRLIDRLFPIRSLSNGGVGLLSSEVGAKGPGSNFVDGATASAQAIHESCLDLEDGRCDVAVAAGYDSLLTVSEYLAYEERGLLSSTPPDRAMRPFDRARDGIVLGEGAAVLVLERREHALRRGAPILGEILGFGTAADTADMIRPAEPVRALRAAIEMAGGAEADFVVAHGIGTYDGDCWEAEALESVLSRAIPVTAVKGYTGYVGAATSAVEIVLALQALREGVAPAIAHLEEPDQRFRLDLIRDQPRPLGPGPRTGLFLSWSWTGQCTALRVRGSGG